VRTLVSVRVCLSFCPRVSRYRQPARRSLAPYESQNDASSDNLMFFRFPGVVMVALPISVISSTFKDEYQVCGLSVECFPHSLRSDMDMHAFTT
jgi:hypothetical protein